MIVQRRPMTEKADNGGILNQKYRYPQSAVKRLTLRLLWHSPIEPTYQHLAFSDFDALAPVRQSDHSSAHWKSC